MNDRNRLRMFRALAEAHSEGTQDNEQHVLLSRKERRKHKNFKPISSYEGSKDPRWKGMM